MKPPAEIKKGLNTCAHDLNCNSCPYKGFRCTVNLMQDAAEALQQKDAEKLAMQRRIDALDQHATRLHATLTEYEQENARLKAELEAVKRERDAAVEKYKRMKENALILAEAVTAYDRQSHKKYNFSGLSAENGGEE